MKNAVSALYGAVVGLLVTIAYEQVFTNLIKWPRSAALSGAVGVGIVLLLIYDLLSNSKALARRLSPLSKVEGAWTIDISNHPERPRSVCKIYFCQGQYLYKGYGISNDGTVAAEWTSRYVHYDEEKDELSFTSDATVLKMGKRFHNYGYIRFFKNAEGKYVYGNGYFVDITDDLSQSHMTMTRITDGEFDDIVTEMFAKTLPQKNMIAQQ